MISTGHMYVNFCSWFFFDYDEKPVNRTKKPVPRLNNIKKLNETSLKNLC